MAKWNDIESSPAYAALPDERKASVKARYFDTVIAPAAPPERVAVLRSKFLGTAAPVQQPVSPTQSQGKPVDRSIATLGSTQQSQQFERMSRDDGTGTVADPFRPSGLFRRSHADVFDEAPSGSWVRMEDGSLQKRETSIGEAVTNIPSRIIGVGASAIKGIGDLVTDYTKARDESYAKVLRDTGRSEESVQNVERQTAAQRETGLNSAFMSLADQLHDASKERMEQRSPNTTIQDVYDDPLKNTLPFIGETSLHSAGDMMLAMNPATLPVLTAGLSNEIAETRMENDGRSGRPSGSDRVIGAVGGVAQSGLESFGMGRLLKPVSEGAQNLVAPVLRVLGETFGESAKRVAKETGMQAGQETAEEGIGYLTETVGTKRGASLTDFRDAVVSGALAGGGLGAVIQAGKEAVHAVSSGAKPPVPPAQPPQTSPLAGAAPASGAVPPSVQPTATPTTPATPATPAPIQQGEDLLNGGTVAEQIAASTQSIAPSPAPGAQPISAAEAQEAAIVRGAELEAKEVDGNITADELTELDALRQNIDNVGMLAAMMGRTLEADQDVATDPATPAAAPDPFAPSIDAEFSDLFDDQGRPKYHSAQSVQDFKSRTGLGADGVRAIQAAVLEGSPITIDDARQKDSLAHERRAAALEKSKAESKEENKRAKENAAGPRQDREFLGEYEIPGLDGSVSRVRVFRQGDRFDSVGQDEGTGNNDISGLIRSGVSVEQALATIHGDHGPNDAPNASRVKRIDAHAASAVPQTGLTNAIQSASAPDSLVPSGSTAKPVDQDVTMQNRARDRAASVVQMHGIANNPDPARLSYSRDPGTGAPMVYIGGDSSPEIADSDFGRSDTVTMANGRKVPVRYAVVEADQIQASHTVDGASNPDYSQPLQAGGVRALNNGRTAGLQSAFARGSAGGYVEGIIADGALHGVSAEAIRSKRKPVLVRVYPEAENTGDMGAESNASQALGLSASEQAATDARALPDMETLSVGEDGDLLAAGNRPFIRSWLQAMGQNEASRMLSADGEPTKQMIDRLKAAIFHRAYGADRLTSAMAEDASPEMRNILAALTMAAPRFARIDRAGAFGDVAAQIADAIELIRDSKARGIAIGSVRDMFSERASVVDELAKRINDKARAPRKLGELLNELARFFLAEQSAAQTVDIFGRAPLTYDDAIKAWDQFDEQQNPDAARARAKPAEPETASGAVDPSVPVGDSGPNRSEAGREGQPAEQAKEPGLIPALMLAAQQTTQPEATKPASIQTSMFAPPTRGEQMKAAEREKDNQRNGQNGTGRTDMMAGDGELFAGPRPEQLDVEQEAIKVSEHRKPWEVSSSEWMTAERAAINAARASDDAEIPRLRARVDYNRQQLRGKMPKADRARLEQIVADDESRILQLSARPLDSDAADITQSRHRRIVESAIGRGESIPAEVLAEYPDLAESEQAGKVEAAAAEAATSPTNDKPEPTDAQKKAGNYAKGHITLHGLGISIENPAGTRRRSEWPALAHHYGYFKGTEGKDGDHVDVFLGPDAENAELPVFVVDQVNKSGRFDEHKVMLGFADETSARAGYLANYTPGWNGLGDITQMSLSDFKSWVSDPARTTKRASADKEAAKKAPPKVTPQIPSSRQLDDMIKVAADSIDKLRKSDVDRVLSEAPAHFRLALSMHISQKRPDLAAEVREVMDETSADRVQEDSAQAEKEKPEESKPDQETPRLTQAEAADLMEWQSLGTKDGVTKHILTFYESKANKDAKRGRMIVATVTNGDRRATDWMVDGDDQAFKSLALAKKRGMQIGMVKAKTDGFVQMSALEQALGADVLIRPVDKAAKLHKEADKLTAEATKMLEGIQPGQPVLSTRDRNLRDRSGEKMRKAAEMRAEADRLDAEKAKGVAPSESKPDQETAPTVAPEQQEAKQASEDRVPEQKPDSKTPNVDAQEAAISALNDGTLTVDQYRAAFESALSSEQAIKEELSGKTKDALLGMLSPMLQSRYRGDKKAAVVDVVYSEMVSDYALRGFSYGMSSGSWESAIRNLVESETAETLAAYAEKLKSARAARAEETAAREESIADPKTLEDFRLFIRNARLQERTYQEAYLMLTPEQRARYDALEAESTREAREERQHKAKTAVRAAGQATDGQIIEAMHTRDNYPLFVVQLSDRLSADDYRTVLAGAKKLGGWYSRFRGDGAVPGFQFKDRAAAEAFVKLAGGDTSAVEAAAEQRRDAFDDDRSQSAVERLREMADRLDESADSVINASRKTNTARRAAFAASALNSAEADKALAKTMRNIASAIDSGTAKFLSMVRTKTQVELLRGIVRAAKDNELRAKYSSYADQEKHKGQPATDETAGFAEFPAYTAFRSDLASLARQMLEVDGLKKLGQQLMTVADDVTDAYIEFAKQPANLYRVSSFSMRRGDDVSAAVFKSKDDAEKAIKRSGLVGKAIVLPVKRGDNRVVMSPSEAINQGIWTGDGDKRITLTPAGGEMLVEAIGRRGNKTNNLTVPWQFQNAYDRRKALSRMGIETPAEFRSALREFIGMQAQATTNKVREMELAMVGRKNDGLDFFPTPEHVADQMIEAAEIQAGMRVLEPSAGMGHIADRIREAGSEPDVIEMAGERRELLQEKGYSLVASDFTEFTSPTERGFTFGDLMRAPDGTVGILRGQGGMGSDRVRLVSDEAEPRELGKFNFSELEGVERRGVDSGYDRIVMNPPFSNRRDAEHVRHAYSLLKPGGRIVAIMGEGVFFGQDKKAQDFREWLEDVGGTSEKLPPGSFMDPSLPVNTGVSARMVVIDKAASDVMLSRPATETITVDGIERPRTNSKGQPIHDTDEGIRNFWRWFGSSRVVDEQGRPLVVYHGTTENFDSFNPSLAGAVGDKFASASFFTSSPTIAAGYAQRLSKDAEHAQLFADEDALRSRYGKAVVRQHQETGATSGDISAPAKAAYDAAVEARRARRVAVFSNAVPIDGANIAPVYLRIESPAEIDADGGMYFKTHEKAFDKAKKSDADGVIVRNVIDRANEVMGGASDVFAVFNPTQIKSAIGNSGTFDPANADIRFSRTKQGGRSADDTTPGVLFTDENDNAIVYEREGFRISVNRPGAASYVVLWAKQEVNGKTYWRKAGTLDTNQKTKKVGGVVGEYLGVSSIEIEKAYRAQGLGLEMYRALMANAAPNIAGVISHTPNRVNKQQVPSIYRKLGAFTDGDNQIIPIGRNEPTAPDSGGAAFSRTATDQTQTEAFKQWFAGSRVVDAEGKPLVVYHGTNAGFTEFDTSLLGTRDAGFYGRGFYFTPDENDAADYADTAVEDAGEGDSTVLETYISLQNPFIWDMSWDGGGAEATRAALADMGIARESTRGDANGLGNPEERRKFNGAVRAAGYDGVIVRDEDGIREVVAFRPNQIKSAIGNNGDFSTDDARITHSRAADPVVLSGEDAKRSALRDVLDGWNGDVPVVKLLESHEDIPLQYRDPDGHWKTAEGFFADGKVFVVLGSNRDATRSVEVLRHEAVGHYGVEQVLGGEWDGLVKGIADVRTGRKGALSSAEWKAVIRDTAIRYPDFASGDKIAFAKEVLAVAAERGITGGIMDRIIAKVRQFLRRLGLIDGSYSEAEARDVLRRALKTVTNGSQDASTEYVQSPQMSTPDRAEAAGRVAQVFLALAESDPDSLMRYAKSTATDLPAVVSDILRRDVKVTRKGAIRQNFEQKVPGAIAILVPAEKWTIRSGDGKPFDVYVEGEHANVPMTGRRLFIDAAFAESGKSMGSGIYAALFQYALNNGMVFTGDPAGLSDAALLRRTEHMLSAAIKHGTTRMMHPHPRQMDPADRNHGLIHTWVAPLKWTIGDDAANIAAMLDTSTRNTMGLLRGTDANGYVYSLSDGRLLDAGGEVVSKQRLVDLASQATATLETRVKAAGGLATEAIIGSTTIARAISAQSLIRQVQGRSSLLADVAERLSRASVESDPLYRAFYSASAPTFYSAMLQTVEAGKGAPKRADATAWMQWLDGAARRGEIKADERYWLGLDEWLDSQQGQITREALADFVRANGVQVTETVLGDSFESMPIDRLRDQWERVFNGDAYDMSRSEMVEMLEAEGDIGNRAADGVPKYSGYTLPGGTNYREVLLTLPEKAMKVEATKEQRAYFDFIEKLQAEHGNEWRSRAPIDDRLEAARLERAAKDSIPRDAANPNGIATPRQDRANYRSGHWDQPNVIAHIRVNDRTDADGKRVLFVEEVQSDWGQEGKKKGFAQPDSKRNPSRAVFNEAGYWEVTDQAGQFLANVNAHEIGNSEASAIQEVERRMAAQRAGSYAEDRRAPAAPFVTKTDGWLNLALKRIIKMAADGGYDRVAFITGEQSAARYDLSKQVKSIEYMRNPSDGTYKVMVLGLDGQGAIWSKARATLQELEDHVGKEIAQKMERYEGRDLGIREVNYERSLSGDGLKVGGEGMKAFYDKIVPAVAKDVLRKLGGGAMETVQIGRAELPWQVYDDEGDLRYETTTQQAAERWLDSHLGNSGTVRPAAIEQPGFTITDTMRQKVSAGLPLFSRRQPQVIPPVQPAAPGVPTQGTMPQAVAARGKIADLTSPESFDRLIYEFQDKFIDLRRVQDRITELGGAINDINDAYLGEELFHARLAKRTQNFLRDELKPLLASLKAAGIPIAEFETFLHARHAPEANAVLADRNPNQATIDQARATALAAVKSLELQLQTAQVQGTSVKAINDALDTAREDLARWNRAQAFRGTEAERLSLSGMTDADAAAHMAAIDPGKRITLDALAAKIDAMQSKTLDTLVSYGLMDKASIDAWRQTYQYYIPLHRDEAHPDSVAHPTGSGFNVRGDASRGRTGSNEKVTHILSHIAMQREAALTRGEKNHVVKKLYLMATQNKDPDFWTVDTPLTSKIVDPSTGFVRQQVDPLFKSRPHVVMLRIAGKDRAIVFNEHNKRAVRLAHSLKNLDVDDLHYVLGAAAKATRWFASVNTQYNPVFGFLNLWRDAQSAVLNLSSTALRGKQFAVLARVLPAMRAVYRERRGKTPTNNRLSRMWEEMQIEGGVTGYRDLFRDAGERAKAIDSELRSMDRGKVSKAAHAIVDWLDHYNTALENAARLAAYDVALSQGMSKPRAASVAKNLTVNFNRKGRQTREVGALYAFFNASVQGNARTLQTLTGPAGKAIVAGGIGIGFVASMLAAAFMGEDDYEKIPDFVRERSLVIPIGGGKYFSWPYPLGFHVLPNLGRIAAEMMMGVKKPIDGYVDTMMIAADTFSPLGSASGGPAQMLSPTALDPAVALMQNSDWTGMPIYKEDFNSLDPTPGHTRAKDSASLPAKVLSQFANWATGGNDYKPGRMSPTPDQIDFITGQVTGGLGREILKAMQVLQAPFSDDELPLHKVPLVGRVIGSTSGQSGEAGRFYAAIRELNVLGSELDGRIKSGDDPQDFMLENPKANLIEFGKASYNQVKKLRKLRDQLSDAGAERDAINAVNDQITETMAELNKAMSEAD